MRRSGDRLKVRVQSVGADGSVRWSEVYDRSITDVFAVQEEMRTWRAGDEVRLTRGARAYAELAGFRGMGFSTPFEHGLHDAKGELLFTDYSSAGNAWNETNRFRVWLPQILDPSRSS